MAGSKLVVAAWGIMLSRLADRQFKRNVAEGCSNTRAEKNLTYKSKSEKQASILACHHLLSSLPYLRIFSTRVFGDTQALGGAGDDAMGIVQGLLDQPFVPGSEVVFQGQASAATWRWRRSLEYGVDRPPRFHVTAQAVQLSSSSST